MALDPLAFDVASYPSDVVEYNASVTEGSRQMPWPPASAAALRAMVPQAMAAQSPDGEVYCSPGAETMTVPVAGGAISVRILRPETPTGLYVHMHPGGWTVGGADLQDATLERLVAETGQAVASLDYRMAPEHPFPIPVNDCEAATRWLMAATLERFRTTHVTIGGESAGATLALVVALRLLREPAEHPVRALNLVYGAYDLGMTPSAKLWGDRGGPLSTTMLEWFYEQYIADPADRRHPDASPLYADLRGLPPTLVTVGTEDLLLDDSLFLHARLIAAGVITELQLVPGACHAFDAAPISVAGPANARIDEFLARAVAGTADVRS